MFSRLILSAFIILPVVFAHADTLDKDGIIRKDDGSIHYMTHYAALVACPAGTRLPTIREWAKLAELNGALISISEAGKLPSGIYSKIDALNPDRTRDTFYYSTIGTYKGIQGDLGNNLFWSSSVHPNDSMNSYNAYAFDGRNNGGMGGYIYDNVGGYPYVGVRCIAN